MGLKDKICGVRTTHDDIRVYLDLIKKEGFRHIHFGCWDSGINNFFDAQDNLVNVIKNNIPLGVKDILDIGGGCGGVSDLLIQDGYRSLCVVPDKRLIKAGNKSHACVKFLFGSAEFFRSKVKFDLALLVESYQYFTYRRKALVNIAAHLRNGASIIILDEFVSEASVLPRLSELVTYLKGLGYYLIRQKDLTQNILPTCAFLENYFNDKVEYFFQRWGRSRISYQDGRRHYLLLVFKNANPL